MQAAEEGGAGKDGDGDASAEPKLGLSGTGTITSLWLLFVFWRPDDTNLILIFHAGILNYIILPELALVL